MIWGMTTATFTLVHVVLSLIGIGYLYQRLLFAKKPPEAQAPASQKAS